MKKSKGFSLIEILVSTAVLSIIAVAASQFFLSQNQMIIYLDTKMSRTQFRGDLALQLSNTANCAASFAGQSLTQGTQLDVTIKNLAGQVQYDAKNPQKSRYDKLIINRIYLDGINIPPIGGLGDINLVLNVSSPSQSLALSDIVQKIGVTTDSTGKILSCSAVSDGGAPSGSSCGSRMVRCIYNSSYVNKTVHGYGPFSTMRLAWCRRLLFKRRMG